VFVGYSLRRHVASAILLRPDSFHDIRRSVMTTPSATRIVGRIAAVSIAGMLSSVSVLTIANAGDQHGVYRTEAVLLADLDLSTASGVQEATNRVHEAARRLCTQVMDRHDRSKAENYVLCVNAAMAQAMANVEQLAMLHANRQLAGNATD
jgi:UrcA family protein